MLYMNTYNGENPLNMVYPNAYKCSWVYPDVYECSCDLLSIS